MTFEELKQFKREVADPRMREIFAKTEIPDGVCFIDSVNIEFLDGRSHGVDSLIEAHGLTYIHNSVQEYLYEMPDASVDEFVAEHKDCVFISDGKLRVFDELDGFEIYTAIRNYGRCAKLFDDLQDMKQLSYATEPLAYLKMKDIWVHQDLENKRSFMPGDHVDILIADCCEGLAKVLAVTDAGLRIEMVPGWYSMIYPDTMLDSNILQISFDDILEIQRVAPENYHFHCPSMQISPSQDKQIQSEKPCLDEKIFSASSQASKNPASVEHKISGMEYEKF